MTEAELPARVSPVLSSAEWVTGVLKAAGPPLLFGLRLWASVCLALYIAFWLELDNAYWAGTSAAIVCQPHLGASLRKGWYRLIGTVIGAVAIVVLTACFPQDRAPFLIGLALWGAGCALVSTPLKNFAAYSAALAGYTVAIIASASSARPAARTDRPLCSPSTARARSVSVSSLPESFSLEPISEAHNAVSARCSRPSRPRLPADMPAHWRWPEPISTIPRRYGGGSCGASSHLTR
jgi:hypothetical protein